MCDSEPPDMGPGMPKPDSQDLREQVVEAAAEGKSRHAAAAEFKVSVSSAIRWLQCWKAAGEVVVVRSGPSAHDATARRRDR